MLPRPEVETNPMMFRRLSSIDCFIARFISQFWLRFKKSTEKSGQQPCKALWSWLTEVTQ